MQYSTVLKSELNDEFRLDAEYYHPKYLQMVDRIKSKSWNIIDDFAFVTDGIHTSIDFDENSNINLISAKSPKDNLFSLVANGYISVTQHEANPRTALFQDDVIISTVGTIGNCAVVDNSVLPANTDRHVGIIRILKEYKPRFLSTFLLSEYGKFQSIRNITGNVQPNLFIYAIKKFVVPKLNDDFQELIEKIVLTAHTNIATSKEKYNKAQNTLLKEVGLLNWVPKKQLAYTKNFSDTEDAQRYDAEYFQPKYDEIINEIKNYQQGYGSIDNLLNLKDRNYNPSDNEYNYIELSNIGVNGEVIDCTRDKGSELPTRARRKVTTGDIIISSIEGSLNSIALVDTKYNDALCSTGFYIVNSESINSETLLVYFKSIIGQMQLKRGCSGTILTAINKNAFNNILIPKIDSEIQKEIKASIEESFAQRKNALTLLEIAKKAVEVAIEQNENIATNWITNETLRLGVDLNA